MFHSKHTTIMSKILWEWIVMGKNERILLNTKYLEIRRYDGYRV